MHEPTTSNVTENGANYVSFRYSEILDYHNVENGEQGENGEQQQA